MEYSLYLTLKSTSMQLEALGLALLLQWGLSFNTGEVLKQETAPLIIWD